MIIRFLKAFNGDAIHIRFPFQDEIRNILIDGGTPQTYQSKSKKNLFSDGELKSTIQSIREKNERIDLLILTHIDNDHIGGFLNWCECDLEALDLIKEIWFNSAITLADLAKKDYTSERTLGINPVASQLTGVAQGVRFEQIIDQRDMWTQRKIKRGDVIDIFGITFKILAPTENELAALLEKWYEESPPTTTAEGKDYHIPIVELLKNDVFEEDESIVNASSIAFILEYEGKSMLFLGDAKPSTIIEGLMLFGYNREKPLVSSFVKLSHHGSAKSTNDDLLEVIEPERFIILTNGDYYGHPDKKTLARVIAAKNNPKLCSNYPSRIARMFTSDDKSFKAFSIDEEEVHIEL